MTPHSPRWMGGYPLMSAVTNRYHDARGSLDREAQGDHLRDRLKQIIGRLDQEALRRVGQRDLVEKRWIADVRQFHGKYDDQIATDLAQSKKSSLFINATRAKTNAMEARLSDMLFPTDDKNWGIQPTPVPELAAAASEAARQAKEMQAQVAGMPEQDPGAAAMAAAAADADRAAKEAQAILDEAKKRAHAMEDEIDDQLRECNYQIESREVIRDACLLGTGVMKGPVVSGKSRRMWAEQEVRHPETGQTLTVHELQHVTDPRPAYHRVDPWSFFPDMDARSMGDCDSVFERHLMNRKELRALAKEPGFDAEAIRRLLRDEPRYSSPQYIADLRSLTGAYHDTGTDRYHIWEYHGPLSAEDMQDIAVATGKHDAAEDVTEADPLDEVQVTVWFCQDEIIKFGIHPLDSGESIYSVFCLEKDEASIFGFGVPHLVRDSQKALNGAWRMMMDNAGLTAGPQIVVNDKVIEPADGDWAMTSMKVWRRKSGAGTGEAAFETYNIDSRQAEMAAIIDLARRNIDEEANLPIIAQGEQGTHTTQTAHGMSILMNSVNVIFRRIVKNFDDDMTTPNIRRLYDWNMQFSDKEHIKGDYEVDARGTSVLLVREMQAQNLMAMAISFSAHPVFGPITKAAALYRRLVQAHMLPADEIVMTDDEIIEGESKAAENPEPHPEVMKLEMQANLAMREHQFRLDMAMIDRETQMMKLAAQQNMKLDELRARLTDGQSERESRERKFAAEAAMTERHGPSGGGYF